MNGLTVDFAHMSTRGKILIKPYPEIADEGNTVGLISESPPCLIQASLRSMAVLVGRAK